MKILLTGGGGRLGTELRALLPDLVSPTSTQMDITDLAQVRTVVQKEQPDFIVHAAAYTNVIAAENEREQCWLVNVAGTRNMAIAANEVGAKLFHISTDYVFSGESGGYYEDDTPGPVVNYYALTKLIAEESARISRRHLIIRTSFRPREFAYPLAFGDVFTSQDYVDVIAPMVSKAIVESSEGFNGILHIGTERKSVFELARRRRPDVVEGSRLAAKVSIPYDVSLLSRCRQKV